MPSSRRLLAVLALLLPATPAPAAKDAPLTPALVKPGKVAAEDAFSSAQLGKPWAVNKGEWVVKDGALVGTIKQSDHHPAVLLLGVPNRNSIIRFSFKFDGSKGFNLSYNSAKGHLFRILVNGEGLTLSKDKDKKNEKSRSATLATASGKIAPGEWHTMLVEVQGGKVAVQTDTGLKAEAANSELDVDKTGYRFVCGSSVALDDVKVWQAAE
jgi:hypothetical protein